VFLLISGNCPATSERLVVSVKQGANLFMTCFSMLTGSLSAADNLSGNPRTEGWERDTWMGWHDVVWIGSTGSSGLDSRYLLVEVATEVFSGDRGADWWSPFAQQVIKRPPETFWRISIGLYRPDPVVRAFATK
jgi:hypothetical protein